MIASLFETDDERVAREIANIERAEAEASAISKSTSVVITLADRRRGAAHVESIIAAAREAGRPITVERPETEAGRTIREYAQQNPRTEIIERLRAELRVAR